MKIGARHALCALTGGGLLSRANADELALAAAVAEFDHARDFGEQGVVLAPPDVFAGLHPRAALAHDDRAAGHQLPAEGLHAQPLRIRIAPVLGTAESFFMCHGFTFVLVLNDLRNLD